MVHDKDYFHKNSQSTDNGDNGVITDCAVRVAGWVRESELEIALAQQNPVEEEIATDPITRRKYAIRMHVQVA